MALRWTYSQNPDQLPTVKVTKVEFGDIPSHLPADVPPVSAEERREQIRVRQEHVQRWYRQCSAGPVWDDAVVANFQGNAANRFQQTGGRHWQAKARRVVSFPLVNEDLVRSWWTS